MLVQDQINQPNYHLSYYFSTMKQDDTLWKSLLEDIFDDFFLFFFEDYKNKFDLNKGFEFLDKELAQLFPDDGTETNSPRFVDKLVKAFRKDGADEWILVHIEVQGYRDYDFPKRMFTYFYRITDKFNKAITSIAIFTDNNMHFKPSEYRYSFMGVENTFKFNTYKIIDQDENTLLKNDNPFAVVVLTVLLSLKKGKLPEEDILSLKIELARALFKRQIPRKKVRALMNFLRYYVRFEKPENAIKFDQEINAINNKNTAAMGIEEFLLHRAKTQGRREGVEETKANFVKGLLESTDFDDTKIASIADVTVAFVEQVKKSLSKK